MKLRGIRHAQRGDMLLVGIGVALVLILLVVMLLLLFFDSPQPVQVAPPAAAPLQIQQVDPTDDANAPVAEEPAEEPNQ